MKHTTMNLKHKAKRFALSIFSAVLLGAALIAPCALASAQTTMADDGIPNEPASTVKRVDFDLTGTWMLVITPDDGTPSFVGYYSFGSDGNASFSSAGPPIPALGSPGYGVWKRVRSNRFAATIRMNSYNESLQFDGTLRISTRIRMTGPNSFITQDTVIVYDAGGKEVVTLGGSTQGKRIVVED